VDVFLVVFMEKNSLASQAQADKVWDNTSLTHSLCLCLSVSFCEVVFWLFFFFFCCLRFRRVLFVPVLFESALLSEHGIWRARVFVVGFFLGW
jgi:hypothetical protein